MLTTDWDLLSASTFTDVFILLTLNPDIQRKTFGVPMYKFRNASIFHPVMYSDKLSAPARTDILLLVLFHPSIPGLSYFAMMPSDKFGYTNNFVER